MSAFSFITFLMDEDVSPALVKLAMKRGFLARSVKNDTSLTGRGDHVISRYAIETNSILVTRNSADFRAIYLGYTVHPGLILFDSESTKLLKAANQCAMLDAVIDEIIDNGEPVQCALNVVIRTDAEVVYIDVDRYYLPDLD